VNELGSWGGWLQQYGYWGLGLALVLNCVGVPIASEVLLPLAGALSRRGGFDLWLVGTDAVVAQMIGLALSYLLARHGGLALLERYGKYVWLNRKRLERLEGLFERHGDVLVFAGSLLPGVHGDVGFPAGLARMSFGRFLVVSGVATIAWTIAFMGLGWYLADQLGSIMAVTNGLGLAVLVIGLLVVIGIWYSKHHARKITR